MKRKIIEINREKCTGCALCADACHEGAIAMIDGKAQLIRDDYCDGLGDCLPACPADAIAIIEREAAEYNEAAVREHLSKASTANSDTSNTAKRNERSCLAQWPCQIKLVPANASYFDNANLLIAADCCAFAYASFHNDFMRNHITIIGCPKLDAIDYSQKLRDIFSGNNIKSISVARMEVPCCGGLEFAVKSALEQCGKDIPVTVHTISCEGKFLD